MEKSCFRTSAFFTGKTQYSSDLMFPQYTKKFLTEARTRIRDRWVPLNRLKSVLKCGTYRVSSVVRRKKLLTVIVGHFSQEKRRLKTFVHKTVSNSYKENFDKEPGGLKHAMSVENKNTMQIFQNINKITSRTF